MRFSSDYSADLITDTLRCRLRAINDPGKGDGAHVCSLLPSPFPHPPSPISLAAFQWLQTAVVGQSCLVCLGDFFLRPSPHRSVGKNTRPIQLQGHKRDLQGTIPCSLTPPSTTLLPDDPRLSWRFRHRNGRSASSSTLYSSCCSSTRSSSFQHLFASQGIDELIQTVCRLALENLGVDVRVCKEPLSLQAFAQTRLGLCGSVSLANSAPTLSLSIADATSRSRRLSSSMCTNRTKGIHQPCAVCFV